MWCKIVLHIYSYYNFILSFVAMQFISKYGKMENKVTLLVIFLKQIKTDTYLL